MKLITASKLLERMLERIGGNEFLDVTETHVHVYYIMRLRFRITVVLLNLHHIYARSKQRNKPIFFGSALRQVKMTLRHGFA